MAFLKSLLHPLPFWGAYAKKTVLRMLKQL